jgi:hypothetical protein
VIFTTLSVLHPDREATRRRQGIAEPELEPVEPMETATVGEV